MQILLSELDAICLPSGENATALTLSEWPVSVFRCLPVAASHTRTVLLLEPDAICLPSGEIATAVTPPE
jgi:hypothetical protein